VTISSSFRYARVKAKQHTRHRHAARPPARFPEPLESLPRSTPIPARHDKHVLQPASTPRRPRRSSPERRARLQRHAAALTARARTPRIDRRSARAAVVVNWYGRTPQSAEREHTADAPTGYGGVYSATPPPQHGPNVLGGARGPPPQQILPVDLPPQAFLTSAMLLDMVDSTAIT
jgi:hypothetical protein